MIQYEGKKVVTTQLSEMEMNELGAQGYSLRVHNGNCWYFERVKEEVIANVSAKENIKKKK